MTNLLKMDHLFRIETDRVSLAWAPPGRPRTDDDETLGRDIAHSAYAGLKPPPGYLRILPRRSGIDFSGTWRNEVPAEVAADWRQTAGPRLFEQTDYSLKVRAKGNFLVELLPRDPSVLMDLHHDERDTTTHGKINFGSQVGMTELSVLVDGTPEFDFQVEIFPAKIDYRSDYEQVTADVQEILTGLVLEYLKATFQLGTPSVVSRASQLEWAILLKHEIGNLEQAFEYIAQHPQRNLQREPENVPAHRIRRVDASLRRAVIRGAGTGQKHRLTDELAIRERMPERTAQSTLDTPEHRWLAHQLEWIQQRLAQISGQLSALAEKNARLSKVQSEIANLEQRATRLSQIPPLRAAKGAPPANFASLKLLSAPGYAEAYRSLQALNLGLRLMGGPVEASIKDLATLYEYWCYLTVVRMCSEMLETPIPIHQLIKTEENGLRVELQKGRETVIQFDRGSGRQLEITYNPQFQGKELFLVAQKPDILLTFRDSSSSSSSSWPAFHIVLDAKYRIDGSLETRRSYGAPAPPGDALNVLYRYRDAIVETEYGGDVVKPRRTVVEAVVLYPYRDEQPPAFRSTRLWQALKQVGVGAIPLLPEGTEYFEEYLKTLLNRGGWALADRVIVHRSSEHAVNWRIAASKPVLIGVLRDKGVREHLQWIEQERIYYMPMRQKQRRQYAVQSLVIYSPAKLRKGQPGAVTHVAEVQNIDVQERKDIPTPWSPGREGNQQQVVYRLGPLRELTKTIENKAGEKGSRARRFSAPRWSSELALERAQTVDELILETEPEWRMYEELEARRINFKVVAGPAKLEKSEDPRGRAWFKLKTIKIQYRGSAGFLLRRSPMPDEFISSPIDVAERVMREG